jgi:hypothetical protein
MRKRVIAGAFAVVTALSCVSFTVVQLMPDLFTDHATSVSRVVALEDQLMPDRNPT